jgi:hypothetical protein
VGENKPSVRTLSPLLESPKVGEKLLVNEVPQIVPDEGAVVVDRTL